MTCSRKRKLQKYELESFLPFCFLQMSSPFQVHLGTIISNAKRIVEGIQEQYDTLASEDKEIEKSFKKDFADCEPFVEQLYKLFRKRPRRIKPTGDSSFYGESKSQNPFVQRPTSPLNVKDLMVELDQAAHMPEGVEASVWERFVACRHKKVDSETKVSCLVHWFIMCVRSYPLFQVKALALDLAEMNAFLHRRQSEEATVQQDIQDAFKELSKYILSLPPPLLSLVTPTVLNRLQEDKMVFDLNLEIQFLLKQGQVEVSVGDFITDFSDSVLVHRSQIEELNSHIKVWL